MGSEQKKAKFITLYIMLCAATFVVEWVKWDISEQFLMKGLINLAVSVGVAFAFVGLLFSGRNFYIKNYKASKKIAMIPILILLFSLSLHFVFPITKIYMEFFYWVNRGGMEEVVEMVESCEIQEFQIGEDKYMLPSEMRLVSHVGRIFTQTEVEGKKVLFYVRCGIWNSSAIIYVPDNARITDGDFGRKYTSIHQIDENWFCVMMRWNDE